MSSFERIILIPYVALLVHDFDRDWKPVAGIIFNLIIKYHP